MNIEAIKQALEKARRAHDEVIDELPKAALDSLDGVINQLEEVVTEAEKQEPVEKMTAHRAMYFMERFKREEKLLGPNEQAAVDFVTAMLNNKPQPKHECTRSHPHEDMDAMCELRTEIARLTNQLAQSKREHVEFPTMLRRMWSGGDVQAWLDANVNCIKGTT